MLSVVIGFIMAVGAVEDMGPGALIETTQMIQRNRAARIAIYICEEPAVVVRTVSRLVSITP